MSSIYRKKGGRIWYLRVTIRGREHRESLQTPDRTLARTRAARRLEELGRAVYGDQRHTWQAAVVAWHEEAPALRPSTVRRYLTSLAAVDHILGPLMLDEIDRATLARIAARPRVTNATRRRDLAAVSVILRAAEARGWLERVPSYDWRRIPERREPIVLPRPAELARLLERLSPMLRRLVLTLRHTGMRLEEAGSLRWDQVDARRRAVTLTHTKAGRARAVPLNENALRTILGTPRHVACPFVFWHSQDEPKRYGDLSGLLYDHRRQAGVRWRIHDLRHLFAVEYLQAGGSIYDLQQILGHSTIAVTERYLEHLTPDEQATAKRIGA